MALVELKSVGLSLGGPPVLDGVDLRVEKGERICLLGRNGEGKTTLLRLLAGDVQPDSGEILRPRSLRVGVLPQEVPTRLAGSVRGIITDHLGELPETDGGETWRVDHQVDRILSLSGLDGEADFATLSAGNKRRTLLARALAGEPDVLLLDEPTNHLDIDAITWLEEQLLRFEGTLFFVTHDRMFLRSLAGRILELDRGRLRDWTCDYDTFLVRREEFLRNEQAQWHEFDRKLAREEVWIRQGVRERRTRNEGRVRELKSMRQERTARRVQSGNASLRLQDVDRSGRLVIRTEGLGFAWEGTPIVEGLDTMIMRGDKVGVMGPNGAGKTTLLRLLLGELAPQAGSVRLGSNLQVAYFDQQRLQLDETRTVQQNVCPDGDTVAFDGRRLHVITYLQNFLFAPDQARSPITHLSGGERNRLLLAKLFTRPANLLVLDEPTNDLDLETLELLEELLADFSGTLLLVSHDRAFLDNVTTSTLALEGDGRVVETVGGYAEWARVSRSARSQPVRVKKDRPARPQADKPRRLTFREKQELESVPARIEELEAEQASLHGQLGDPKLYREEGDRVVVLKQRLDEVAGELPRLYARWEELEGFNR
ncbi:ABC transporter ATP-binding protein [bacterium]|nr:MAG: ABC transporter ATP-binding protein [bacterium]